MKTILFFSAIFTLSFPADLSGQAKFCDESTPPCLDQSFTYAADTTGTAEPGAYYGCLVVQIAPAWFHMRILDPGIITISMFSAPLVDIDFICWGPFTDPYAPCVAGLTSNKVVDCAYSPNTYESCVIPNGQTGEYYILMITNYSQQPTEITLEQTTGNGSLDCNLLYGPDLVVKDPGIYPETILAGDTLTVSGTVFNQGNQDAAVSKLFYYLSPDTVYNHSDLESGYEYNGTLEAGDSIFLSHTVFVPEDTSPGTWYILFFADADEQIEESDEENNVTYVDFTVDTATWIDDPGSDPFASHIKVYPNPTHDRIYLDYSGLNNIPLEIEIYTSLGTRINTGLHTMPCQNPISISTRNWPAGFYLLLIKVDGALIYTKVQVIN
jgi:hypothetical protein